MTKNCIICKCEATPIHKRSFHKFPKCDIMREKWIAIVNSSKPINFNTAYICSDHFYENDYHGSDEFKQRQRLKPNALPNRSAVSKESKKICNLERTVDFNHEHAESKEILDVNRMARRAFLENDNISNSVNIQSTAEKDSGLLERDLSLEISVDNESGESKTDSANNIQFKKRTYPPDNKPVKKIRFMIGYKVDYICREDFVSEKAWRKFLEYRKYKDCKLIAAHKRNSRMHLKINKLSGMVDHLKEKEEFDAAEYLKVELLEKPTIID